MVLKKSVSGRGLGSHERPCFDHTMPSKRKKREVTSSTIGMEALMFALREQAVITIQRAYRHSLLAHGGFIFL